MHYIDTSLAFEAPDGTHRLPARELILHFLNADEAFNTNGVGLKASLRLDAAVKAAHDEDGTPKAPFIRAEAQDFKILCNALDNPRPMHPYHAYPVRPARVLSGLIDSIKAAPETEPAVEAIPRPEPNGATAAVEAQPS